MQMYAITDGAPPVSLVRAWSAGGVHFIQLRARHLSPAALTTVGASLRAAMAPQRSKLLINLPSPDLAAVAVEAGADGVHVAGEPRPGAVRIIRKAFAGRPAIVSLPCHTLRQVALANSEGADLLLFSPIYEKGSAAPQGLAALEQACQVATGVPVFALGGVTADNAGECVRAGAAGVAGIRLFAGDGWRRLPAPAKHI